MDSRASQGVERSNDEEVQRLRVASSTGIRPVTIRQLVNATRAHSQAPFCIDNIEVLGVVLVAQVVRVRRYDTATLIDLEDGAKGGKMIAKRWLNGKDSDGLPSDEDQYYARIIGTLARGQETRNTLNVQVFQKITDPHQMLLHILEAAFVTLCLERGPPPESVRVGVETRFQSGGHVEQFTLPSAPTTPAVARVQARAPPRTPASLLAQTEVASSPAIPDGHLPALSFAPARPPTPPSPTPQPQASSPSSPSTSRFQTPVSSSPSPSPSPSPPPPQERSEPPQTSSAVAIQQPSESRRVSGIKRDPWAHLTVLERAILLQIFNASSDEDVSVRTIASGVRHHNVAPTEIGSALDSLTEKGFIVPVDPDAEHYTIKTSHYPTSS